MSCEIFELKKKIPSPKTTLLIYESTSNSRKSLKYDFRRASVVAVAVAQITAKVLEYWRDGMTYFPGFLGRCCKTAEDGDGNVGKTVITEDKKRT